MTVKQIRALVKELDRRVVEDDTRIEVADISIRSDTPVLCTIMQGRRPVDSIRVHPDGRVTN